MGRNTCSLKPLLFSAGWLRLQTHRSSRRESWEVSGQVERYLKSDGCMDNSCSPDSANVSHSALLSKASGVCSLNYREEITFAQQWRTVTVSLESRAFISRLGNHINLISLFVFFEKQITLPSEDTAIFIRQMKWARCLLFFRHLHSCSMEFRWDLGCYRGLGLAPCRAAVPMPWEQMGPLSVTLAYFLLTCHNNRNILWLAPATLDYMFGQIWMVNPRVPLLW